MKKLEELWEVIKMKMAPTDDNSIDYLKRLEGIHAFVSEFLLEGSMVAPTPEIKMMKHELDQIRDLAETAINEIADADYRAPPDIRNKWQSFMNHILKTFHKYNMIDRWNRSKYSGMDKLQEELKSESWWNTLKTGGTITSGKAGITNMTYGKGAKKPKKPKKIKEEEFPIVPKDLDFWRD